MSSSRHGKIVSDKAARVWDDLCRSSANITFSYQQGEGFQVQVGHNDVDTQIRLYESITAEIEREILSIALADMSTQLESDNFGWIS